MYVIRRCLRRITDSFKITIGSCKFVQLFISGILGCTHGITFGGRFECIGRMCFAKGSFTPQQLSEDFISQDFQPHADKNTNATNLKRLGRLVKIWEMQNCSSVFKIIDFYTR